MACKWVVFGVSASGGMPLLIICSVLATLARQSHSGFTQNKFKN
jgi:hypothetical protein